jgi:hypothetical protein
MKTAKEWFDTMITGSPDIKEVISEIQREAYNQALEDASENATLSLFDWEDGGFKEHKRKDNKFIINDGNYVLIDKQSILKLKK